MDNLLEDLLNYQRKKLDIKYKLDYRDLKRLTKYINDDFFSTKCCIWANKKEDGYITFYFRKKKVSLYRILYYNFVGNLKSNEYIRCVCENRGKCCNVNHLKKFQYINQKNYGESMNDISDLSSSDDSS